LSIPSVGPTEKILISAECVVRDLRRDQLFLETRDLPSDADPKPTLDSRRRSHVQIAAKFMATDWFGFEVAYEDGSLPPAFSS
jgi:hypothetical protein